MNTADTSPGTVQERTPTLRLRKQGYTVVTPAGSHAPVDLVAWDGAGVRFIRIAADRSAALATEAEMRRGRLVAWKPGGGVVEGREDVEPPCRVYPPPYRVETGCRDDEGERMTDFITFDLEIAEIVEDVSDLHPRNELGISCAATLTSGGELKLRYGRDADGSYARRMEEWEAWEMATWLHEQQAAGVPIVTWNGLGFDLHVLATESGDFETCAQLAEGHVDLMFAFHAVKGFPLSLKKAAHACGVTKAPVASRAAQTHRGCGRQLATTTPWPTSPRMCGPLLT